MQDYQGNAKRKCLGIDSTVTDGLGGCFSPSLSLVFCSHIVVMAMLEAVQANFDHFYNHDRGGITKYDGFVPHSALPSSLEIKGEQEEKGQHFWGNFFSASLPFL